MGRLAVVASFIATLAGMTAQPNRITESYQHLSDDGRLLFDTFANSDGQPNDAAEYHRLNESQRTTFESVAHALESTATLGFVESVTAIWGEDLHSADGRDQFRLSVILATGAVDSLLADSGFKENKFGVGRFALGLGHVKLPIGAGAVIGRCAADSVQQNVPSPNLQISWLTDDHSIGEIDIDYREKSGEGHRHADNSDVRDDLPDGTSHYDLHVHRYGSGLEEWWR